MDELKRFEFGDIVFCETNTNNPNLNERNGYLLFIKGEFEGFYAIKGCKKNNLSESLRESYRKLGLLLGEDNSDLHVDVFFDYNDAALYSYDIIIGNGYRWSLSESLKNEAVQGIINAENDGMYPETFKINGFLESIKYTAASENNESKNISMVNTIQNGVIEKTNGISRKRTNVVSR